MPDYSKGKIYKIVSDSIEGTYYGSSINTLSKRLSSHINKYKLWKNGKYQYVTSFKLLENNDYHIFLVENYPCKCKEELTARERYYIENNECVNKYIPGRTRKEWCEANKERLSAKEKEWREANKELIREKMKEYYEANKEQIKAQKKEWREANKDKIKEYYEANKDKIKEYREANKERRKIKYVCICDGEERNKDNKARHERTQYHKDNYKIIKKICNETL